MTAKRLYRALVVMAIVVFAAGASMVSAGTAWAVRSHDPKSIPRFDAGTGQVEFTIPTQCPIVRPVCLWVLFVNEPLVPGKPVAGTAIGSSGTLAVPYPEFCGVVQVDVLVGPKPFKLVSGMRQTIDDCPTTTTTSTSSTSTTSTTSTTTTTTTTTTTSTTDPRTTSTTKPTGVSSSSTTPTTVAGGSALPFTASNSSATSSTMANGSSQLPYTGAPIRGLLILGFTLMLAGGALLVSVESRRRMLRRVRTISVDDVKDGTDRMTSWFLGR